MVFYHLYVDGLYQFKEFTMDLTYARESKYSPVKQQLLKYPNVKFKKVNILLGANASGKTSLGKVMCTIQNFIKGRDISSLEFGPLKRMFENKLSSEISFKVIFSEGDYLYRVHTIFTAQGLKLEEWNIIKLSNKSIRSLIDELVNKPLIKKTIKGSEKEGIPSFRSIFLQQEENAKHRHNILTGPGYIYSFSDELGGEASYDENMEELAILKDILMSVDQSIRTVTQSQDDPRNAVITFKNGDKEILVKGNTLSDKGNSILSSGSKEAIFLTHLVIGLKNHFYGTLYIDEKMSHSHSEIEQQIIQIMISLTAKQDCQLFITSHNTDLLDLHLPNYNFGLFKKNNNGEIRELIQPELSSKHQNRSIRKIVNEDIFGTSPNLTALIKLHDQLISEEL